MVTDIQPPHLKHKICFSLLPFKATLLGDTEAALRHKRATFLQPQNRPPPPTGPGRAGSGLGLPVTLPVQMQQFPDDVTTANLTLLALARRFHPGGLGPAGSKTGRDTWAAPPGGGG